MTTTIRNIRVEGNIAYVPLSKGLVAVIDADDYDIVAGINWYAQKSGRTFYAKTNLPRVNGRQGFLQMHTLITGFDITDHIDGDGLNNRKFNLRPATKKENMRNRRTLSNNTSGFKGVTFRKDRGVWQARIMVDRKSVNLGFYACPKEAHNAYCRASSEMHGEFGRAQ